MIQTQMNHLGAEDGVGPTVGVLVHEITSHRQHDIVALIRQRFLLHSRYKLVNACLQYRINAGGSYVYITLVNAQKGSSSRVYLSVVPERVVMHILLRRAANDFIEAETSQRTVIRIHDASPHLTAFTKGS